MLIIKELFYSLEHKQVLNGLNLNVNAGKITAVLGANGSGKTTLLNLIAGLLDPDAGRIDFNNQKVEGPKEKLVAGHSLISIVKQDNSLFPLHTVRQNLLYILRATPAKEQKRKIDELSRLLDLKPNLDRVLKYLSGGEQQRVAIAASLAASPQLLLMDEPFSQTDIYLKHNLKSHLQKVVDQIGIGILYVTHDPQDALSFSDEILVLERGRIIEKGKSHKLYYQPKKKATAILTGYCNWLKTKDFNNHLEASGLHKIKNEYLIRPDQVMLVPQHSDFAIEALVEKVSFFGAHQYVHLLLRKNNTKIVAAQIPSERSPLPGEEISIAFDILSKFKTTFQNAKNFLL